MRYSRQEKFIGNKAQAKIRKAKAAIIGLGALGSVTAEILARAGIGKLILVDPDILEENNLQRQSVYTEKDIGKLKVAALKEGLLAINSGIVVETHPAALNESNLKILRCDIILDCTDNLEARRAINKARKTWIFASAIRDEGYVKVFRPGKECFDCLFPQASTQENCCNQGVLGTIIHAICAIQANECLKFITGNDTEDCLLYINIRDNSITKINSKKRCRHFENI